MNTEDPIESTDPLSDVSEWESVHIEDYLGGDENAPIIARLRLVESRNPELYEWLSSIRNRSGQFRGRGAPLPRIIEAALVLMMEWKKGRIEVRRKTGGSGGALFHHQALQSTLQNGRNQMRTLAEKRSAVRSGHPSSSFSQEPSSKSPLEDLVQRIKIF